MSDTDMTPEEMVMRWIEGQREDICRRARYLREHIEDGYSTPSHLAGHYLDEAERCWAVGLDIASICLAYTALEELLRANFRRRKVYQFDSKRELDRADYSELVSESLQRNYITKEETDLFRRVAEIAEPYLHTNSAVLHPKDADGRVLTDDGSERTFLSFEAQENKIDLPPLVGTSVEHEAKEAVTLMEHTAQTVCRRWMTK